MIKIACHAIGVVIQLNLISVFILTFQTVIVNTKRAIKGSFGIKVHIMGLISGFGLPPGLSACRNKTPVGDAWTHG